MRRLVVFVEEDFIAAFVVAFVVAAFLLADSFVVAVDFFAVTVALRVVVLAALVAVDFFATDLATVRRVVAAVVLAAVARLAFVAVERVVFAAAALFFAAFLLPDAAFFALDFFVVVALDADAVFRAARAVLLRDADFRFAIGHRRDMFDLHAAAFAATVRG